MSYKYMLQRTEGGRGYDEFRAFNTLDEAEEIMDHEIERLSRILGTEPDTAMGNVIKNLKRVAIWYENTDNEVALFLSKIDGTWQ